MSQQETTNEKDFSILTGIAIGFTVLYLITGVFGILLTACVVCWASLVPAIRRPVVKFWLAFTKLLGTINSKIVLSVVWFLFLTPIAWLFRLSGKDPMQYKKGEEDSLFTERNHQFEAKDLDQPW